MKILSTSKSGKTQRVLSKSGKVYTRYVPEKVKAKIPKAPAKGRIVVSKTGRKYWKPFVPYKAKRSESELWF